MSPKSSRYHLTKNQALPYHLIAKVSPEMAKTLGDLIQEKMKSAGIGTKSELARRIGKSSAYVGDLINNTGKTKSGTYTPSQETIKKLAQVLDIDEAEILQALDYLPKTDTEESKDVFDEVRMIFKGSRDLTDEDKDDLNRVIEMARASIEKRKSQKLETTEK